MSATTVKLGTAVSDGWADEENDRVGRKGQKPRARRAVKKRRHRRGRS